ncbi:MAG: hypothetical protein ACEQSB_04580 [Undibacterium sp.]
MPKNDGSTPPGSRPEKIVIADQATADAKAMEIALARLAELAEKEVSVLPAPEPVSPVSATPVEQPGTPHVSPAAEKPAPAIPDPQRGAENPETSQGIEWHLTRLKVGQSLRYRDKNGVKRVVERSPGRASSVLFFTVRTIDRGKDQGSKPYQMNDLVRTIQNEGWQFRGKDKPEAVAGEAPSVEPLERGIETPAKIEERLNKLKSGRSLEYVAEDGTVINIFSARKKEMEVEYDNDLRPMAMGDVKVFDIVQGEGQTSSRSTGTIDRIVEQIAANKWKFRRNREYSDPVISFVAPDSETNESVVTETETSFLNDGEEAEFDYLGEGGILMHLKLRREFDQYLSFGPDGAPGVIFTEAEIRALAQSQGFVRRTTEVATSSVPPMTPESGPEMRIPTEFLSLPEGQPVRYTNKFFGAVIILERRGDQFQITDEKGEVTGFTYDAEHIARVAEEEQWQRAGEAQQSSEAAPVQGETPEQAALRAARDAEVIKLRKEVDTERSAYVAKEQEQSGAWNRLSKLFHIEQRAADKQEVLDYKQYYENALTRWKNSSLERLKHMGLDQEGLRQEMAALIREIEFEESDRLYDERLKLRVEKTSVPAHKRMKELWDETANAVTTAAYFEDRETGHYTQREVIHRDWMKFMVEGSAITGQAALRGVKKTGEAWNKVTKGKAGKYILTASLAGAGAVAFGVYGGGALVGALALKRALSGAAVSVTLEKALDGLADERRKGNKERFHEEERVQDVLTDVEVATAAEMNLEGGSRMPNLDALSEYLDREGIAKIHDKAKLRKYFATGRKAAAIFAGAAVGGMIPKDWFPFSTSHAAPGAQVGPNGELPTSTAVLREVAAGPDAAASAAANGGVVAAEGSTGVIADGPAPVAASANTVLASAGGAGAEHVSTERAATLATRLKELTSTHTVGQGESIWKIATNSVKDLPDMDKRSTTRFAKLLELRLQEKLTIIDPKLAEAAGFTVDANGNFTPSHIELGAKLELGKLISNDEMAKLIEEAKGDSPITLATAHASVPNVVAAGPSAPIAAPELTETERVAIEEARIEAAVPAPSADERAEILGRFNMSTELVGEKGDVMRYVGTLPREEQEHLFRNFRRITTELFQTNEVMGGETYDMNYDPSLHPEFSKTYISRVISDHKVLWKNPFTSYDRLKNPLHGSQMEAVVKFSKAAVKAFGQSVAEPRATESIQEYVLRMVAVAENQQVKIPGFRMIK